MNGIFKGIRPLDYVLATVLTAIGVALMVMNVSTNQPGDPGLAHAITNQSWLMIPAFTAVTLPILVRRRSMTAVVVVTAAALGAHVLAFDWVIRCGAGLPLAFALAYGVGRLTPKQQWLPLMVGVIAIQFLVLVRDSAAGLSIIPFTAAISLVFFGVGALVAAQAGKRADRAAVDEPVLV